MAQLAFFNDLPEGLRYEPEFMSSNDETSLISEIQNIELKPFEFGQFEGKRRVAWFGWRYDYTERKLQKASELPAWIAPLASKIDRFDGGKIAQVLVTEYEAETGIGWHRDKPHFDKLFGVSLSSPCKFRFRKKRQRWERFSLGAAPRSLYRMTDEARHLWEHSIPPVEELRYSITLRTMESNANFRVFGRAENSHDGKD